ncbi:PD-(D/E)XK nuclease domain-containing protein [Paraburkholderia graminis]|uniref:PD-(D/E)XK nuclease domain-containing protein n=1 Tax=Paraburkholderia graminis TaxID=60548 RepID=UPI0038BBDADF
MNIKTLLGHINGLIEEGYSCVGRIEATTYNLTHSNDYDDEEHNMEVGHFSVHLKKIYASMCLLIEALGYKELLVEFKSGFKQYKKNLTTLTLIPYIGEYYSEPLSYVWMYYENITKLFNFDATEHSETKERTILMGVLQNTPKIVYDRKVMPESEADVKNCVYELLIHVFPDTVREVPISQVTKTYKPDIGIKSLKTAVEYKYAVSAEEAKKIIGGIYEDIKGYGGSEDWKHFYAVLYMTEPFYTLQQIQAEFNSVGVGKNWVPILVHGNGTRRTSQRSSVRKEQTKSASSRTHAV